MSAETIRGNSYLLLCTAYGTVNFLALFEVMQSQLFGIKLIWNDMLVKYTQPALVRTEWELLSPSLLVVVLLLLHQPTQLMELLCHILVRTKDIGLHHRFLFNLIHTFFSFLYLRLCQQGNNLEWWILRITNFWLLYQACNLSPPLSPPRPTTQLWQEHRLRIGVYSSVAVTALGAHATVQFNLYACIKKIFIDAFS